MTTATATGKQWPNVNAWKLYTCFLKTLHRAKPTTSKTD